MSTATRTPMSPMRKTALIAGVALYLTDVGAVLLARRDA